MKLLCVSSQSIYVLLSSPTVVRDGIAGAAEMVDPRALCLVECGVFGWRIRGRLNETFGGHAP